MQQNTVLMNVILMFSTKMLLQYHSFVYFRSELLNNRTQREHFRANKKIYEVIGIKLLFYLLFSGVDFSLGGGGSEGEGWHRSICSHSDGDSPGACCSVSMQL